MATMLYGRNIQALADYGIAELDIMGKKLGDLPYVSDEPYWSSSYFAFPSTSFIASGTNRALFSSKIGDATGQGSNWQLTYADTNVEVGSQFPRNQCFVGLSIGVDIMMFTSTGGVDVPGNQLTPDVLDQIAAAVSWSFKETGQIERKMGLLQHFPSGTGVYSTPGVSGAAASTAVHMIPGISSNGGQDSFTIPQAYPIVLRPLVNVEQKLNFERAIHVPASAITAISTATSDDIANVGLTGQVAYTTTNYLGIKLTMYGLRFNVE